MPGDVRKERLPRGLAVRDVERERAAHAARVCDGLHRFVEIVRGTGGVRDNEVALARKRHRDGSSDAARSAGDKDGLHL